MFYRSLVTPGYEQDWRNIFFSVGRANIPYWRVAEIGEMFQNVSARAFIPKSYSLSIESVSPNEFVTAELEAIRYAFGIMAAALILFGALRHKRLSYVEVYLASYTTILMLWPFTDVRFWAPVLPLFFAYGWIGLRSMAPERAARRAAVGYCVIYSLFGAVAMLHSLNASTLDRAHGASLLRLAFSARRLVRRLQAIRWQRGPEVSCGKSAGARGTVPV